MQLQKNAIVNRVTDWIIEADMHPNPLCGIRSMVQLAVMQSEFHRAVYDEVKKLDPKDQTWAARRAQPDKPVRPMIMYPNDEEYEDQTISNVRVESNGWVIEVTDGWSFLVPKQSPVIPKEGMTARFYGKGTGFEVRGLFIDGQKVYYLTEDENKEKREIDMYGADAYDWLSRWDEGKTCWTIEMGGLGPGYEQCIHITMAEILRYLLEKRYNSEIWDDCKTWERDRDEIETACFANTHIRDLGLSGAQWGAAMNLAIHFYRHGPRSVMTDERVKSRHIQVRRTFPS